MLCYDIDYLQYYNYNILFLDQRNLGMSMRIERSTLDQVKQRFELNKQKKSEQKKKYDLDKRLQELQEEVKYPMYIIDIHKFKCKNIYYTVILIYPFISFNNFRMKEQKNIEKIKGCNGKEKQRKQHQAQMLMKKIQKLDKLWGFPVLVVRRNN